MVDEYYSKEETLKKLALKPEDLETLVREGKLREFRIDGEPKYKIAEVDKLSEELNPPVELGSTDVGSESAIELLPSDSTDGGTDVIPLEDTGTQAVTPDQKDTVITPAGVNVFDEDELAGLETDPMAKTQIAPSVTDELSIEGGGSGLLDMTRESDDTSLGADLLDEIAVESSAVPVGEEQPPEEEAGVFEGAGPVVGGAPVAMRVEMVDPLAGLFTGLVISAIILIGVAGLAVAGMFAGVLPRLISILASNMLYTIIGSIGIAVVGLIVGYLVGKK